MVQSVGSQQSHHAAVAALQAKKEAAAAATKRNVGETEASAQPQKTTPAPPTGISSIFQKMAADMQASLVQAQSADTASSAGPTASSGAADTTLPIGLQHYMKDIASDPAFAEKRAKLAGGSVMLFAMKMPKPGPIDPATAQQMMAKSQRAEAAERSLQSQTETVLAQDQAAGKSGAQTYADILKTQLSQPQSYWDAVDPDHLDPNAKSTVQAELSALRQDMAANKGGGTSINVAA